MDLKECVDKFVEKVGQLVAVDAAGPSDEGAYILTVDGEVATVFKDGSVACDVEALKKNLDKHFAPYQRFAAANNGPSDLPRGEEQQPEEEPAPFQEPPTEEALETPVSAPSKDSIYDQIIDLYGPDLIEVFGESGNLKSKGFVALAMDAVKHGKKVLYLDTENNLSPAEKKAFAVAGVQYKYTPVMTQIGDIIMKTIPNTKADLVIIDSVGMPILRKFATLNAKQRGDALLELIAWLGSLKEWSFNNNGIALVSNQPASEFGKTNPNERGDNRFPFGDKGNFIPGHILLAKKDIDGEKKSSGHWLAFRSRCHGKMAKAFKIEVDNNGPTIAVVA